MFNDRRIRTSLLAILTDIVLTVLKAGLALISGSAALLADAYHSATDLIVSVILLVGIVVRHKQEMKGDDKSIIKARRLESCLAIFVACIILYVPFEIVQEIQNKPAENIENLWLAIAGTLLIIAIVFFIARLKTHVGQQTDSPALEADGYHSMVDVFSSIAVLLSLIGYMVGIYLDDIVAILIAVMIGVSGLELLVSGFKSAAKGTDLEQFSIADIGIALFNRVPLSSILLKQKYKLVGLLLLAYLASGFKQVPYGYIGIHKRFGQNVNDDLSAGLHYTIPWPIDSILYLPEGEVWATTTAPNLQSRPQDRLWRELKKNLIKLDDNAYIVTADEKLIDLVYTLQYRAINPLAIHQNVNGVEDIVRQYVSSVLSRHAATTSIDRILHASHLHFADRVAETVKIELGKVGVDIEIVDAQIAMVQPPAGIVRSYRDVLNASQERQQLINREIAKRLNDLPIANAEVIEQIADVKAASEERSLKAEGDLEYAQQLAKVFKNHPDAFSFNRYIETIVSAMKSKSLTLVDDNIDQVSLRTWVQESNEIRRR